MTDRKKLQIRLPSEDTAAPDLKKKGRGWEISEKRLDNLHDQARKLRRHSSEAHKALAERFAKADLGPHVFKRHAVIGSAIVDFGCHTLGVAISIDEEEPGVLETRRDKSLESVGMRVMRLKAEDVLENMDDVLARITVIMRERMADKKVARAAHQDEMRKARSDRGPDSRPTYPRKY